MLQCISNSVQLERQGLSSNCFFRFLLALFLGLLVHANLGPAGRTADLLLPPRMRVALFFAGDAGGRTTKLR